MLQLTPEDRRRLWARVVEIVEDYINHVADAPVTPEMAPEKIRALLRPLDFQDRFTPTEAVEFAARYLWQFQTHTPHPRYYGLFNPAPATMGVAGDMLTAAFNPQIAAWAHSPFAAEVEAHLVRSFAEMFGYDRSRADGVFCSGGAEANHTAVLGALTRAFPRYPEHGVRELPAQPVLYASAESHHSFLKAARICGIGTGAVREVPTDSSLRMDPEAAASMIAEDRRSGLAPFMIAGTAGTTNAGIVDPLRALADVAVRSGTWFHVDAAWGGAAALSPRLRGLLDGIALADSITFDAHKWLSAPMGAGVFLTRDPGLLDDTFRTPTAYMPRDAEGLGVIDPHLHSMQWSRRFIGLKVFLSLLVAGWQGYAEAVERMTAMGELLRDCLRESGWEIVNRTPLPVVCFAWPDLADQEPVVRRVVRSGEAWISTTQLGGRVVIRACITNYRTGEDDVRALVASLDSARTAVTALL